MRGVWVVPRSTSGSVSTSCPNTALRVRYDTGARVDLSEVDDAVAAGSAVALVDGFTGQCPISPRDAPLPERFADHLARAGLLLRRVPDAERLAPEARLLVGAVRLLVLPLLFQRLSGLLPVRLLRRFATDDLSLGSAPRRTVLRFVGSPRPETAR